MQYVHKHLPQSLWSKEISSRWTVWSESRQTAYNYSWTVWSQPFKKTVFTLIIGLVFYTKKFQLSKTHIYKEKDTHKKKNGGEATVCIQNHSCLTIQRPYQVYHTYRAVEAFWPITKSTGQWRSRSVSSGSPRFPSTEKTGNPRHTIAVTGSNKAT